MQFKTLIRAHKHDNLLLADHIIVGKLIYKLNSKPKKLPKNWIIESDDIIYQYWFYCTNNCKSNKLFFTI